MRQSWTPLRVKTFVAGIERGDTSRIVAEACGMSHGAVLRLARAMKRLWKCPLAVAKRQVQAGTQLRTRAGTRGDEPTALGAPGELISGCKWLHGDEVRTFRQCGAPLIAPGAPYCAHHAARAIHRRAA